MPFWSFKRRETPIVTSLEDRLSAIERRLTELAADNAGTRREWADTLDKLQTWFGREAARKRQQLHRSLEAPQETPPEAPGAQIATPGMSKADLRRIAASRRLNGGIR